MSSPSPTPVGEITPDYWFGHGKRLTRRQRRSAITYILRRDFHSITATCFLCKDILIAPYKADIDHINGVRTDHRARNLRLACHSCNSANQNNTASSEGEKDKEGVGVDATESVQGSVDYSGGSTEMQVTVLAEIPFRNWVYAIVKSMGSIERKEAVYGGAELFGVSPQATYRYLGKLKSGEGKLMIRPPTVEDRRWLVVAKPRVRVVWDAEKAVALAEQDALEQKSANHKEA